jgi:hypothetical protein
LNLPLRHAGEVEFTKIDMVELRHTISYGTTQIKKEERNNEGERNSRQKKLS